MTEQLMVSISGVRGVWGSCLTDALVRKYVSAFAAMARGGRSEGKITVVVGRDSRVSGPEVIAIACDVLLKSGLDVVECGIVPTPTVQVMVQQTHAAAGLVITSSHNPQPWNGLKFVGPDGLFFPPDKCGELFRLADTGGFCAAITHGTLKHITTALQTHISLILALPYIDRAAIARRGFKVCVDAVCGAGGPIVSQLLHDLGCAQVTVINAEPTGVFPHAPEPIPCNLEQLCEAVVKTGADLGIAVDPDVDRCVLIDETGKPLVEEYTLALAVQFLLGVVGRRGPVCKNLSTTRAVDDVAKAHGCPIYATPVGEIQVAKKMVEVGAAIGGEGNGGVMLPDIHIGRDAPVAVALTMQHLAHFGGTISQLKATFSQYNIVKLSTSVQGVDTVAALETIKNSWSSKSTINESDGLHISTENWWVHLRKSNTEPIIRIIAESTTVAEATRICEEFKAKIEEFRH